MKLFSIIIIFILNFSFFASANDLIFFIESAYNNNPKLNAQRQNLKAIKENVNITRSEFLPSVSLSGDIKSAESSNRTDQNGSALSDTSLNSESQTVSIDQKVFKGFEGYNSFLKSKLETDKADLRLLEVEQEIILSSVNAYYDLIYRSNSKKFNYANVDLFERQVESDSTRMQKGEITLTDLAQSESSLAAAKASYILSETKLLSAKTNFERIIVVSTPDKVEENYEFNINLPNSLSESLNLSKEKNPKLLIAKLDYKISEKNVNIEKSHLSPSASINYSKTNNSNFSSTVDDVDQETVKATIVWPIVKGGENYFSLRKAKFKREQSNLILEDTGNEVKTNTVNAWSSYQSAEGIFRATQAQVTAAEIANEGITLEYDSGSTTRTTLDVIQSRSLLLEARIDNAKAKKDFAVSKFKLLEVIGKLTLENIRLF